MKLTLNDLIERKKKVVDTFCINVPELGGELEVKRFPSRRFFEMMDYHGVSDSGTALNNFDFECALIYASVPMFRSKELQDAWEVKQPEDIVSATLSASAIGKLSEEIVKIYVSNDIEDVKN